MASCDGWRWWGHPVSLQDKVSALQSHNKMWNGTNGLETYSYNNPVPITIPFLWNDLCWSSWRGCKTNWKEYWWHKICCNTSDKAHELDKWGSLLVKTLCIQVYQTNSQFGTSLYITLSWCCLHGRSCQSVVWNMLEHSRYFQPRLEWLYIQNLKMMKNKLYQMITDFSNSYFSDLE